MCPALKSNRFLWIKFQLDDLCKAETDDAIRKTLQNLPKDLSETYDRLLSRIDGTEKKEYIRRMFNWIIAGKRPLQANEMREAIAFTVADTYFDSTKIPNNLQRLVRACGNLVFIDEDTQNVQLAHYTVQQYLLDPQRAKSSGIYLTLKDASMALGKICVTYLSFNDFETQVAKTSDSTSTNFQALAKAVITQPLIAENFHGRVAEKALKTWRRPNSSMSSSIGARYSRHIPAEKKGSVDFKKAYALLSYIIENWLWHTVHFDRESDPINWIWSRFDELVLYKKLPFSFRPWDGIATLSESAVPNKHIYATGWALLFDHKPCLKALFKHDERTKVSQQIQLAIQWFFTLSSPVAGVYHIPQRDIGLITIYKNEEFPDSGKVWEPWLYSRLLYAFQNGTDTTRRLLYSFIASENFDHQLFFFSHLSWEAVSSGEISRVGLLESYLFSRDKKDLVSRITCAQDGLRTNALERAAVHGHENICDLFLKFFPPTRKEFQNALAACLLQNAARDGNEAQLRCLIRLATTNSGSPLSLDWDWDYATDGKSEVMILLCTGNENEKILKQKSQHFQKTRVVITMASKGLTECVLQLLQTRMFVSENRDTTIFDFQAALLAAVRNAQSELVHFLLSKTAGRRAIVCPSARHLALIGGKISVALTESDLSIPLGTFLLRIVGCCGISQVNEDHIQEITWRLLDAGAKPKYNPDFSDLLLVEIANGCNERAEIIIKSIKGSLIYNPRYAHDAIIQWATRTLLKGDYDFDFSIASMRVLTLLEWAIFYRNLDVVKTILRHFGYTSLVVRNYTPLQLAIIVDSPEIVKFLIGSWHALF